MHIDKIKNVVYRIKACSPHVQGYKVRAAQHDRQTRNINKDKDPQKNHRLGMVGGLGTAPILISGEDKEG